MKDNAKPSILRRATILTGTAIVIGISGGAVAIGSEFLVERVENAPQAAVASMTSVAVDLVTFEDHYTTSRRFLGQIEATADTVLSFELGGRLAELTVGEGESVTQGDVVARLDTALLEAERARLVASRNATQAQLAFAQSRLARAQRLQGEGFSSQETLDQARATRDELNSRIAEVEAALSSVAINIEKSVIRAPFDGRVGAQNVDITETLSPGQHVLTLIETGNPIVRVGLPLSMSEQDMADVMINVEGALYPAQLDQLRPDIDPTTRTRTALFTLQGDIVPTFGQTATLLIETDVAARGAWISLDALQQGSGSIWTALVVEDQIVRTAAVEVLYQQSDRAFVRGTFAEGAQLIRTGAHRVVPGQQVHVLQAEG